MNDSDKREILHKELDLIQAVITRMAQNSFTIKGWYFALIIVISAWKFGNTLFYICTIALATVIFYILNLQFYIYERRYREIYKNRIELRCEEGNYEEDLYCLVPIQEKLTIKLCFKKYVFKNKMLLFMYLTVCALLISANVLMNVGKEDKLKLEEDNVKIEIEGLKNLLNSIEE